MSKGELWKGVAISAIIGVTFGVIAYYIISYALQMVGVFGEAMGIDARSREIYADVHKWVHIFSAACGRFSSDCANGARSGGIRPTWLPRIVSLREWNASPRGSETSRPPNQESSTTVASTS